VYKNPHAHLNHVHGKGWFQYVSLVTKESLQKLVKDMSRAAIDFPVAVDLFGKYISNWHKMARKKIYESPSLRWMYEIL